VLGSLWRRRFRFDVPMLFALGMIFNFLIGGITGVFLSDVPVDVTVHGSFFVLAPFPLHHHGRPRLRLLRRDLLLVPEVTGRMMNQRLGKIHFWAMFTFFNLTFFPLFIVVLRSAPPGVRVRQELQTWNDLLVGERLPARGVHSSSSIANFV